MHQRDQTRHVTEPEAGDQTRLQRELLPQPQGVAHPDQVRGAGELVVDAVQAAVRRDDAVAQDLAQPHHLECRRATLGVTGQALLADTTNSGAPGGAAHRVREPLVQLGLVRVVGQRGGVVLGHHRDVVRRRHPTSRVNAPAANPCLRDRRPAHRAPERGSTCAHRRRRTTRRRRLPARAGPS